MDDADVSPEISARCKCVYRYVVVSNRIRVQLEKENGEGTEFIFSLS